MKQELNNESWTMNQAVAAKDPTFFEKKAREVEQQPQLLKAPNVIRQPAPYRAFRVLPSALTFASAANS